MKKNLNQNLINIIEYYDLIDANHLLSNTPLKRNTNNTAAPANETKLQKLTNLKKKLSL